MTKLIENKRITVLTHYPIARDMQEAMYEDDSILAIDLDRVRSCGLIGTAKFSEIEEQGKLVIIINNEGADRIYSHIYETLKLDQESNGMIYMATVGATTSPQRLPE